MKVRSDLPEIVDAAEKVREKAAAKMRTANTIGRFVTPMLRRKVRALVAEQVAACGGAPRKSFPPVSERRAPGTTEAAKQTTAGAARKAPAAKKKAAGANRTPGPTKAVESTVNVRPATVPKKQSATRAAPPREVRVKPRPIKATPAKPANALGIDGYDGLPSSAIVPLLDGLTKAQLRSVEAYESRNRARRTVLHRTSQLLG
jgi:hypothetical protein